MWKKPNTGRPPRPAGPGRRGRRRTGPAAGGRSRRRGRRLPDLDGRPTGGASRRRPHRGPRPASPGRRAGPRSRRTSRRRCRSSEPSPSKALLRSREQSVVRTHAQQLVHPQVVRLPEQGEQVVRTGRRGRQVTCVRQLTGEHARHRVRRPGRVAGRVQVGVRRRPAAQPGGGTGRRRCWSSAPSSDASGNSSSTTITTGAGLTDRRRRWPPARRAASTRPLTGVRGRNTSANTSGAGDAYDTHIRKTGRRVNSTVEPTPSSTPTATASAGGAPRLGQHLDPQGDPEHEHAAVVHQRPATPRPSRGGHRPDQPQQQRRYDDDDGRERHDADRPLMSRKTKTSLGPAVDVEHRLRDDEPGEDEQLDQSTAS